MKLLKEPELAMLYKETVLKFSINNDGRQEVISMLSKTPWDPDTEYEIVFRKKRKRRSLDANAYAWSLIGKIAWKIHVEPEEVYREQIRHMSTYEIVPIQVAAVKTWTANWERQGIGWIVEDMGPSKIKGYKNLKCFYGSSVFETGDMARLIELIQDECRELGVETLTPKEKQELLATWEGGK